MKTRDPNTVTLRNEMKRNPYSKGKVGAESLRVGFLRCPRRGVFPILFPVVAVSDLGVST